MKLKNFFTFGYAEKEEAAKREFEQLRLKWQEWETEAKAYDQSREKLNETISKILYVCKEKDFQKKTDIVSELYGKFLQNNISFLVKDVSVGQSATVGVAAGAAGAIGVFTLVGTFGVASTGVAISSLAGAAATSATLAALGGGSLAAGGAGMLGGICVLGGVATVIAVPGAMTFTSYLTMKKYETTIKEIKKALEKAPSAEAIKQQKKKLNRLNDDLEKQYQNYDQGIITAEELCDSSKKLINDV